MFRFYVIAAFFILSFFACEKEVEIEVERIPPKLVVVSNFSDGNPLEQDSFMRVTVTRTTDALNNTDTLINVPDAIVELFEGETFVERLDYYAPSPEEKLQGIDPYYTTNNYIPESGNVYRLKVSAPGFSPVTAEGFIPSLVSPSQAVITTEESTTLNRFSNIDFTLSLKIDDLVGVENFYHLNLYQVVNLLRFTSTGDTSRSRIIMGPLAFNLQDNDQEVLPYIDNQGVLIKDTAFDGEEGTFTFTGNFLYNPRTEELSDFIVELRNTSRDYYLYHSSLARQVRVQAGFDAISGAVVLHNNIENGCGVFAGYTPVFTAIDLSD